MIEDGILKSTKAILGIVEDDDAFDQDILVHINSAFSTLGQLGVNLPDVSGVDDRWSDVDLPSRQVNMIRSYLFVQLRLIFDPPTTSFHLAAVKEQIAEFTWRISHHREVDDP